MARFRRRRAPGLIFHSDRPFRGLKANRCRAMGSQYASNLFSARIKAFKMRASKMRASKMRASKMRASMSRKGDCSDNAVAESLFGSLKGESLDRHDFGTRRAASDEIMAWITTCNHTRLQSTPGYLGSMQFEKKWLTGTAAEAA